MAETFNPLKLKNQLCFPLYACSREVIKQYKPFLDEIDLTYTQYITMMVLWERESLTAKELGEALYLDSGTLTPLLKKMEGKGLLTRHRDPRDERSLVVTITDEGKALREKSLTIPSRMVECIPLKPKEAAALYSILYKLLGHNGAQMDP